MKCDDIKYNLLDYIKGKVSNDEHKHMEEHISKCESCQREAEELLSFYELVKNEVIWRPEDTFWASLLPRIHHTLDNRKVQLFPQLILKYIMPISAAIVLVIFSINYFRLMLSSTSKEEITFSQLQPDELQYYIDQQSIVGEDVGILNTHYAKTPDDDVVIIEDILQSDKYSSINEIDYETIIESIDDQEINNLVSILENNIDNS